MKVLQQQTGFTFKIQVVKYCRVHYFSQWPRSCWVFSLIVKPKNFLVNIFLPKKSLGPTVDGNYPLSNAFYLPSSYINYFFNCKFSFYEVSTYTKTHSIRLYLWTLDINKKVNGSSQQTKHPEQKKVCCQLGKILIRPKNSSGMLCIKLNRICLSVVSCKSILFVIRFQTNQQPIRTTIGERDSLPYLLLPTPAFVSNQPIDDCIAQPFPCLPGFLLLKICHLNRFG